MINLPLHLFAVHTKYFGLLSWLYFQPYGLAVIITPPLLEPTVVTLKVTLGGMADTIGSLHLISTDVLFIVVSVVTGCIHVGPDWLVALTEEMLCAKLDSSTGLPELETDWSELFTEERPCSKLDCSIGLSTLETYWSALDTVLSIDDNWPCSHELTCIPRRCSAAGEISSGFLIGDKGRDVSIDKTVLSTGGKLNELASILLSRHGLQ